MAGKCLRHVDAERAHRRNGGDSDGSRDRPQPLERGIATTRSDTPTLGRTRLFDPSHHRQGTKAP